MFVAPFSLMFPPYRSKSSFTYLALSPRRLNEKQNKSLFPPHGVCLWLLLKQNSDPVKPGTLPRLPGLRLLTVPVPWLTPEEQSGSQQSKGVRSLICQNREYVSVCNYAERSSSISATVNGEPPFWWYSLGRRARWKREREEGREQGRNVNCNQAAQHVKSWTRSTRCQPGMKAALTIPSWASGSRRDRIREARARNATHLGAQLSKTNASGHREGISG